MILTIPRRDRFFPLSAVTTIPSTAQERLAGLGVTTVDELRDLWNYGNKSALVDYLGESPLRWFAAPLLKLNERGDQTPSSVTPLNPLNPPPGEHLTYHPRGLLTTTPPTPVAPAPINATPAREPENVVNLAHHFPPPRDQGLRGTCVAFATVALLEYHAYRNSNCPRHSEQFFYWACKQLDGIPNTSGTFITIARKALAGQGACFHTTWRYDPTPIPGNEAHHPPPPDAATEAASHTRSGHHTVVANDIAALCAELDQDRPVVLGVETFAEWDYPSVQDTGEITMPLPGSTSTGGHAICVVGYERRQGVPGNGAFIFRNSWSGLWAQNSRYGEGYGTLWFEYVRLYGREAFA